MTNSRRLKDLEVSQSEMAKASNDYDSFQSWQAKASALLAYDIILRHQFIEVAKVVVRRGEFPLRFSDQHSREIRRILEQAMADLRVLAAEDLHQDVVGDQKVVATGRISIQPDRTSLRPQRAWTVGEPLGADQGILWFWHHSDYRVKWALVAWAAPVLLTIFGFGFAAGLTNLLVRLFDAFHETSATAPANQHGLPSTESATRANSNEPAK